MDDERALFAAHTRLGSKNLFNAFLVLVVPLPSVLFTYCLCTMCPMPSDFPSSVPLLTADGSTHTWERVCSTGINQPLLTLNIVFFLNVCVLFWIINVVQQSTWLIDPYWTIIPPLIAHFYGVHPAAHADFTRSLLTLGLIYAWSIRLTHSYFRREDWKFGVREDWRFEKKRKEMPNHFWWYSFFYAFVSQQPMLVGVTLPFYTIQFAPNAHHPWDIVDLVITISCIAGLIIAYFADTQLRNFMLLNKKRLEQGLPKIQLLNHGLWYYSRHPNYFGEQLFWWSLAAFSWRFGVFWPTIGTIFNSVILAVVTVMTEKKIASRPGRAKIYAEYQATTSACIPFFKFSKSAG